MNLWERLGNMSFRDGFWFLLGGLLGCHLVRFINQVGVQIAGHIGEKIGGG